MTPFRPCLLPQRRCSNEIVTHLPLQVKQDSYLMIIIYKSNPITFFKFLMHEKISNFIKLQTSYIPDIGKTGDILENIESSWRAEQIQFWLQNH